MDYNNQDIIIARATPVGKSALAAIRLSGSKVKNAAKGIIKFSNLKPNNIKYKKINSPTKKSIIDTSMVSYYSAPKSFTGEDMIEIFCHGNDIIVDNIIDEFLKKGARIAYPGEFSYRAFKNGKIDLLQAESIAAKINQNSKQYGVALQNIESGYTSNQLVELREEIVHTLTIIEHELDFNEEEINHTSVKKIQRTFKNIHQKINLIIKYSLDLQKIERGYKVVLVGLPNVGKSTLFNRLLGEDRAIVTNIKGTTRDVIESTLNYDGMPISLYDTAGYRKTNNKIERLGISKTLDCAIKADIMVFIDDINPKKQYDDLSAAFPDFTKINTLYVKSKSDLKKSSGVDASIIEVSCKNDFGIDLLLTNLLTKIKKSSVKKTYNNVALCNTRQMEVLKKIDDLFVNVLESFDEGLEMDIIASQIKDSVYMFEELLGKMTTEEVLNNIFKGFCVGK